jgi:predicted secreted protein
MPTKLFSLLLVLTCMGSCNPFPGKDSDTGKPIVVKVGQQFTLHWGANHSTPYHWKLAHELDPAILKLVKEDYVSKGVMPGSPGVDYWTFEAVGKGKTTIAVQHVHLYDKDRQPVATKQFSVTVR